MPRPSLMIYICAAFSQLSRYVVHRAQACIGMSIWILPSYLIPLCGVNVTACIYRYACMCAILIEADGPATGDRLGLDSGRRSVRTVISSVAFGFCSFSRSGLLIGHFYVA